MSYWCSNCGNMAGKPMEGLDNSEFCNHCQTEISIDIEKLSKLMEEMANSSLVGPIERQPGEKCSYEIQRRENENGRKIL